MQGVYVYKENVVVLVYQLYSLLHTAILIELDQTPEAPYAVVDMYHIIAHFQGVKLRDGHLLVALYLATYAVTLVAVKYLMVGVYAEFQVVIHKSLVEHYLCGVKLHRATTYLMEDVIQSLDLRLVVREDVGLISALAIPAYVVGQKLEVAVERGLRRGVEELLGRCASLLDVIFEQRHGAILQVGK